MRVLVAEDDTGLRSVLARGLREHGYVVDAVVDGQEALSYLRSYTYEVVVLDWRMPTTTGIEVVRQMRARGDRTPVLMLTARDTTEDRVEGLNEGADDYLVKPFSFAELTARLSALQRRPPLSLTPLLECGDLTFDPPTRLATRGGATLALTAIETGLLELLLRRSPAPVTRQTIAVQVWDDEADPARIETVRGFGYRIVPG
jgi:DNA-binding response OmpR family regulator